MKHIRALQALLLLLIIAGCNKASIELEVSSNIPGAKVFINGNDVGETPLIQRIKSGSFELVVKKEGYVDYTYYDTILSDSSLQLVVKLLTPEEHEAAEKEKRIKQAEYESFRNDKAGVFTDFRDGKKYKWVKIGAQIWMAENMAYRPLPDEADGCWAYENNEELVSIYGYLYSWETAINIAPEGWHLPKDSEWQQMISYLGGENKTSEKTRERGYQHWIDGYYYRPIATNESGFTARPGGQRNEKGEFLTLGTYANWWSATSIDSNRATCYWMGYMGDYLSGEPRNKNIGLSIRCIKD